MFEKNTFVFVFVFTVVFLSHGQTESAALYDSVHAPVNLVRKVLSWLVHVVDSLARVDLCQHCLCFEIFPVDCLGDVSFGHDWFAWAHQLGVYSVQIKLVLWHA